MEPIYNREEYSELHWSEAEIKHEDRASIRFDKKKRKELIKMEKRRRKEELHAIHTSGKDTSEEKQKITTSKRLMYVIMINCMIVEIYSMWAMFVLKDLSALYSLIGAVISESISYAIYCAKSFKESKEEARIALERDKFQASLPLNDEIPDEENEEDVEYILEEE